jgi:hypothetical protein
MRALPYNYIEEIHLHLVMGVLDIEEIHFKSIFEFSNRRVCPRRRVVYHYYSPPSFIAETFA